MSTIIELIITFVLYFLICLAAALPFAIFYTRKMEKLMSNYFHEIDEIDAARLQSLKEVHAQVDELDKSVGESADKMSESFDKMNESMDRTIEFKRLMRDYSNLKIKRTEARENFCESQFWDEKKYTLSRKTLLGSEREKSHYKISL